MKTVLSITMALGVGGLVAADDKKDEKKSAKVDAIGTWKCEYEIGGNKRTSTLSIKKDGDKLAGTMSWADQKNEKLKDFKLKEATLTFSAVRNFMDQEIPIDYTLKIEGDKLKGKGASDFGGQSVEFEITAKREKEEKKSDKKDK